MGNFKLFDAEYKFINIVWEHEPITSTELVKKCSTNLGWKKSTTYTVLKKLSERGILQNEKTYVTTLVKREEVQRYESEQILERTFENSLPSFVATFLHNKKITHEEAEQIKKIIEEAVR
jgi:predicted transcriptional regulator